MWCEVRLKINSRILLSLWVFIYLAGCATPAAGKLPTLDRASESPTGNVPALLSPTVTNLPLSTPTTLSLTQSTSSYQTPTYTPTQQVKPSIGTKIIPPTITATPDPRLLKPVNIRDLPPGEYILVKNHQSSPIPVGAYIISLEGNVIGLLMGDHEITGGLSLSPSKRYLVGEGILVVDLQDRTKDELITSGYCTQPAWSPVEDSVRRIL